MVLSIKKVRRLFKKTKTERVIEMKNTKKFSKRLVSIFMVIILLTTMGFSNVYAAGVETFKINNNYHVGTFTFTCDNTTPTKTVQGRYLYTYLEMKRSPSDQGIASTAIKVVVKVLDASTLQQIGGDAIYIIAPNSTISGGFERDLGYAGRKVVYRFDSYSYNGPTNAYYRTVYVADFMVNTSNYQGSYFG